MEAVRWFTVPAAFVGAATKRWILQWLPHKTVFHNSTTESYNDFVSQLGFMLKKESNEKSNVFVMFFLNEGKAFKFYIRFVMQSL